MVRQSSEDRSKHHMSMFMRDENSKSNLSSICHLEDASQLSHIQNTSVNHFTGEKFKIQHKSRKLGKNL